MWRTLSELWGLSDPDLLNLHDQVHELANSNSAPVRWYHGQVVETMVDRGVVHYDSDELDSQPTPDLPLEIQTGLKSNHRHTAMSDEYGNGFTDPVEDHYHSIERGVVVISDGHDHTLAGTFKCVDSVQEHAHDGTFAGFAVSALRGMSKRDSSMVGGRVGDSNGHSHLVLVIDSDSGFGQTSFDGGHSHWVLDWNVQDEHDHRHDLALRNLEEVGGVFQALEDVLRECVTDVGSSNDKVPQKQVGGYSLMFDNSSRVKVSTTNQPSADEAWELWESENRSLLVTPVLPGLELQAHLKSTNGNIEARLFTGGADVTGVLGKVISSLKITNMGGDHKAILSGTLTTKRDRHAADATLRSVLGGKTKDHVAVFYVEDCWLFDESLEHVSAYDRKKTVERILAGSTTPALKQMSKAMVLATERNKAVRVTERSKSDKGSIGARWRDANATMSDPIQEIIIG